MPSLAEELFTGSVDDLQEFAKRFYWVPDMVIQSKLSKKGFTMEDWRFYKEATNSQIYSMMVICGKKLMKSVEEDTEMSDEGKFFLTNLISSFEILFEARNSKTYSEYIQEIERKQDHGLLS